ncbi:MAG TPA: hypothetical protein VJW75_09720 [Candidatus Eisenbacteria bacterium]|nr:hypothetical protein [Candidatus Eisenbacteria bacterium]
MLAFVTAMLVLALLAATARAETRTLTGSYAVGSADKVDLDIPYAEITIEGVDSGPVRVRVKVECREGGNCGEYLRAFKLESKTSGHTLKVKLDGGKLHWKDYDDCPRLTVVVQVPRALEVDLDMWAGEVDIRDLREDLSVDLGAGEITIHMPERAVGTIEVNMAIGEATIHHGGRTQKYAGVYGGPIHWRNGTGTSGIEVNLWAGELDVSLD